MLSGNFAAAASEFQKAIDIEPTKLAYTNLGLMYYYLGDLDAAIDSHKSAVQLQSNDHLARSNLGDALWIAGRKDEAQVEFEKAESMAESALSINPNDPFTMMDLAWIRAMLDRPGDARVLMDKARNLAPDDPYTYYYDALISLRAGDETAALSSLVTAVEKGYSRQMLRAEPHLAVLRNDPRFLAIVNSG
jgi:Flp pilus assembly protein TadD